MSAYLRNLNKATAVPVETSPGLQECLAAWLGELPEFCRLRPFAMREFEVAWDAQVGRRRRPFGVRLGAKATVGLPWALPPVLDAAAGCSKAVGETSTFS